MSVEYAVLDRPTTPKEKLYRVLKTRGISAVINNLFICQIFFFFLELQGE